MSSKPTVAEPKPYIYHARLCGVKPMFVLWNESEGEYYRQYGGAPEAALIEWASQFLTNKGLFLDIGANVGTWAITYALMGHQVIAWEPHPRIYSYLGAGCALNNVTPETHNVALGARMERASLRVEKGWLDGGGGSIVREFDTVEEEFSVVVTTLDDYSIAPTFVKIDTEGAELDVLQGGCETFKRWHPAIIFECWKDEKGQRTEELFRYLTDELGYQCHEVGWADTWLAIPK